MRMGLACLVVAVVVSSLSTAAADPDLDQETSWLGAPPPRSPELASHLVVARISKARADVSRLLALARKQRDVVRVLCLNDKLSQLSLTEAAARDRRTIAGADPWAALRAVADRAAALLVEANQCVGEETGLAGEARVMVSVDAATDAEEVEVHAAYAPPADGGDDARDREAETLHRVARAERSLFGAPPPAAQPNPLSGGATSPAPPPGSPYDSDPPRDAAMLIRTADVGIAVFDVKATLDRVQAFARELGGYMALRTGEQLTVRIPRNRFDEALARVHKLGDVLHENIVAEDVTDEFVDLEMRLANALKVRERLEQLLARAEVKDAIEIQKELAKVTEEIERLRGKLKLLRDRVSYSTLTVTVQRAVSSERPVQSRALLPFPWMNVVGLGPLLEVRR